MGGWVPLTAHLSGFFFFFPLFLLCFFEGTFVFVTTRWRSRALPPVKKSRGDHAPAGEFKLGGTRFFLGLLRAFKGGFIHGFHLPCHQCHVTHLIDRLYRI